MREAPMPNWKRRWPLLLCNAAVAAIIALTAPGRASAQAASSAPLPCSEMVRQAIPASLIHLLTNGARVTGATSVAAAGIAPRAVGAFCRVTAEIAPVDRAAPPIKLEVNLPEDWNGKALMFGGGGYNGSILSTPGTIRLQPTDMPIPLGRGYATFGSNSGHDGTSSDGSFATNEEALRNYAYEALKKTRDVAGVLIQARYGRPAEKVYFHGSSTGGKEAFAMIQKYPADLDGAIIFWPAVMFADQVLQYARVSRALLEPGAYLDMPKRQALLSAATAACDGLDGASDGVISDSRKCQTAFDPSTASLNGKPLRCSEGVQNGDACLSEAQIRALKVMATPITFKFALGDGQTSYPGFNVWGADLGAKASDELSRSVMLQGLGDVPPGFPTKPGMPFMHIFSDQFMKFFVAPNPQADWRGVDPENPGEFAARIAELTRLLDMSKTDLSEFAKRGGKIIMLHGMSDQIVPIQATERYFNAVERTMGRGAVAQFFKFYELPGTSHSGNGIVFTPTWDALGALDNWAVKNTPPASPVITDIYGAPGRTRPLCEYPMTPRYSGTGDMEKASSFSCAQ
jgi:hypothetical protein